MAPIGLYARLTSKGGAGAVDERTWRDLDLDAVFAHVDRTASAVGQQLLYARLCAPPREPAERAAFDALVERFGADRGLRERTHLAIAPLADLSASTLPILFLGEETPLPWPRLPLVLTIATLACFGATLSHPAFVLAVLACFGLNVAMRFRLWKPLSSFLEPAR
jgi:hypothetical protein